MCASRVFHLAILPTVMAFLTSPNTIEAHNGGIIIQKVGDQLVTGYDDESGGTQTIGVRAFSLLFPSSLANDVPSFLTFATPPWGSEPLPPGGELYWDFLPMTVEGVTSNLLYWDGIGSGEGDVEFGTVPQDDVGLHLYTEGFTDFATVTGTPEMVAGKHLGTISTTGSSVPLHAHRWYFMDADTTVPQGVYLFSIQLRMEGYTNTEPFFIVAATDEISAYTLDSIALPWVDDRVDSLILDGDYVFDGVVDGADFLAWQRQAGLEQLYPAGPFPVDGAYADGDGDNTVGVGDLTIWEQNFGTPASFTTAPYYSMRSLVVPEPYAIALLVMASAIVIACRFKVRRRAIPQ